MFSRRIVFAIAAAITAPQEILVKPIVVPMFEGDGPAFVLECRNETGVPLQPGTGRRSQMWLDGTLDRPAGEAGSGGPRPVIPPGGSWRELVALPPQTSGRFSSYPGVANRSDRFMNLSTGRHTVAFECGGVRSDDIPFYWKDVPR